MSPGLGELNLNEKRRGEKKPNLEPVRIIQDAENLLSGVKLIRSLIVGKISEFFDPCGFFEPVKLQMKLLMGSLKGKKWEEVLPEEDQIMWREILKGYVELPNITIPVYQDSVSQVMMYLRPRILPRNLPLLMKTMSL